MYGMVPHLHSRIESHGHQMFACGRQQFVDKHANLPVDPDAYHTRNRVIYAYPTVEPPQNGVWVPPYRINSISAILPSHKLRAGR
jgi:hypothetical protein